MAEHKLLHCVVPADLVDRAYAAADAEGVTLAEWVTVHLGAAVAKPKRRKATKR